MQQMCIRDRVITVLFLLAALTVPSGAAEETVIVLDAGHGGNDNGTQGTLNGTTSVSYTHLIRSKSGGCRARTPCFDAQPSLLY